MLPKKEASVLPFSQPLNPWNIYENYAGVKLVPERFFILTHKTQKFVLMLQFFLTLAGFPVIKKNPATRQDLLKDQPFSKIGIRESERLTNIRQRLFIQGQVQFISLVKVIPVNFGVQVRCYDIMHFRPVKT